jgi:hypothetical protein
VDGKISGNLTSMNKLQIFNCSDILDNLSPTNYHVGCIYDEIMVIIIRVTPKNSNHYGYFKIFMKFVIYV